MIQGMDIEKQIKAKTGMEIGVYLMNAKSTGVSLGQVARYLGCQRRTLVAAIKRNKIDWKTDRSGNNLSYYGVMIDGIVDSQRGHCRRLGINIQTIKELRRGTDLTFPDALKIAVGKKEALARRKAA